MSYGLARAEERRVFERFVPVEQAFIMSHKNFAIIKDISLGGLAVYSVKNSTIGQAGVIEVFLSNQAFIIWPDQVSFVDQSLTPGQAIAVNRFSFVS